MKISFKNILLYSLIGAMFNSCAYKEDMLLPNSGSKDGSTLVIASVENFSRHNVSTKATDEEESRVKNLAMLIFGGASADAPKQLITAPVYVDGANLNFVINTTESDNGQYISDIQGTQKNSFAGFTGDLSTCRLYIVANLNDILRANVNNNTTEVQFLNIGNHILTTVPPEGASSSSVNIPENGFPMIGSKDINLTAGSAGSGSEEALTVPMKKLFAKVNFKFLVQVDSENIPAGMDMVKTPYFEPIEWSVHNIPTNYTLRDSAAAYKPVNTVFATQNFTSFNFSTEKAKAKKKIENSTSGEEYFDFSFYMPEYKVLPVKDRASLPAGIESNLMQCHKPTFCDTTSTGTTGTINNQKPTYVRIKGKYSDHQGHISEVQYSFYLGQNEIDDFQILRNQELNNIAIVKGLTNYIHDAENNISIDHRVEVTSSGYSIAMERETLLDSHFEVRPMDISVQEGAVVVVKLPQIDWFGAERADAPLNSDTDLYETRGNRKYFTTTLINELGSTSAAKQFVFHGPTPNDDKVIDETTYRLWFYFDENTSSPYDAKEDDSETNKLYRERQIKVDYYESETAYNDGDGTPTKADREFTFRQMNLWSIHADINDYNIEYFEEYLYNYASDDNYGVTTDGMAWGLNDLDSPLSTSRQAIYVNQDAMEGIGEMIYQFFGGSFQSFFNTAFSQIDAKYDFYMSRDNVAKPRDFAGIHFTKEIVNQAGIDDNILTLSGDAASAVEYCYNKNKRNSEGKVETVNWYLPAIDETEEILVDGFEYFKVFQSKYYWSSQPSFHKYNFTATYKAIGFLPVETKGAYYGEDIERARATIVTTEGPAAESGVDGAQGEISIYIDSDGNATLDNPVEKTETPQEGNQLRTKPNRIRCAYSKDGIPHIFGDYVVNITENSTTKNVPVTISKSNDLTQGNVMLSNYLHVDFNDIGYPQYANYDKETKQLTISMNQLVGVEKVFATSTNHKSVLYVGNDKAETQIITLLYDSETHSFSVVGEKLNLRTDNKISTSFLGRTTHYANYINSFTRATE